jgi:Aspartate carbamoyltransferase, catalytic chain
MPDQKIQIIIKIWIILNITFIGDLKNGRPVKSLVKLLSRYKNNNFNFYKS